MRGKADPKAVHDRMLSLVARKVVAGGGDGAAGDNGKKGDKGPARELEGCKTFAKLLEVLQGRVAEKF